MANEFNANDILEIAKQIEINGARYYREAANRVDEKNHKLFLTGLAEMEDTHEKTFADMQKDLEGSEIATMTYDPQNESALYLKALADTRVFFEKTAGNHHERDSRCRHHRGERFHLLLPWHERTHF